jgi:hypothetical protein
MSESGRFDRVTITGPEGTVQMTGAEFEALPLDQRIKSIIGGKAKFSLNGRDVPVREALRGK